MNPLLFPPSAQSAQADRVRHAFTSELSVHEFPFLVGTSLNSYVCGLNAPADQPVIPIYTSEFLLGVLNCVSQTAHTYQRGSSSQPSSSSRLQGRGGKSMHNKRGHLGKVGSEALTLGNRSVDTSTSHTKRCCHRRSRCLVLGACWCAASRQEARKRYRCCRSRTRCGFRSCLGRDTL